MAGDQPVAALRISQLDAAQLDQELLSIIRAQLTNVFQYHQTSSWTKFEPEITVALKLLIWKFSVFATGATVGQKILSFKYANVYKYNDGIVWMSSSQKILHAVVLIVCPWLKERTSNILSAFGLSQTETEVQLNNCIKWIEKISKVASLINFVIFLQRGQFASLTERLLGIQSMFPRKQGVRQVHFDYVTRELLWHGFSEFIFFVLPLINLRKLKSLATRYILPSSTKQPQLSKRTWNNLTSCAVCDGWPQNPQHIGCSHIFCFYCIQVPSDPLCNTCRFDALERSNYLADSRFLCPKCGKNIPEFTSIQPVTLNRNSYHPPL